MNTNQHIPVLLHQSIDALSIKPHGIYVDATFGRGGHSQLILERLSSDSKLLVIDQDPSALRAADELAKKDNRVIVCPGNFSHLSKYIESNDIEGIDGILFDLGVSSPQLDVAERGFSFNKEGPLDMRMDNSSHSGLKSAAEWLKKAKQDDISHVLWFYGEEQYSKRISRAIVTARTQEEIKTTTQLAEIIKEAHPNWPKNKHPATKSFMAIRLFVNQELEVLKTGLEQAVKILNSEGRLVVITFHSLEDRIVKQFMKEHSSQQMNKNDYIINKLPVTEHELVKLQKNTLKLKNIQKPIKAGIIEGDVNVRARSAILRVATKI